MINSTARLHRKPGGSRGAGPKARKLLQRSAWSSANLLAFLIPLLTSSSVSAQAPASTHSMTLSNATETIDRANRRVFVAKVDGDLPGVLTLALVIGPDGTVTGGEWALNVSYIQFGPPDTDGDGDASESLVQRGVIKGSVSGGSAVVGANGLATSFSGIQLNITGATMQFAGTQTGNGTAVGSSMNLQTASNGLLTISF